MSALVASIVDHAGWDGETSDGPSAAQERYVAAALDCLQSRAAGDAHQLRAGKGAVIGVRETWSKQPGDQPDRLATREIGAGRVTLAISGSVDNLDEFRPAASDEPLASVLLDAYLAEGPLFVQRLGGAFAIVLHDPRTHTTLAFRDRLGIEPLYYWRSQRHRRTLFASEPKGILADPGFPRTYDISSLLDLLNSTSRVPGTTVYRELREVRPGEILAVTGNAVRSTKYWSLPILGDHEGGSAEELAELVSAVTHETSAAVCRRLGDATQQGFLLSGGLDSSVICASARQALGDQAMIRTYSFVYEDAEKDFRPDQLHASIDTPFVTLMRDHLGTEHAEITVSNSGYVRLLERTVGARDMPGVGDLDMALLRLFEAVSEHSREVFSGEGADDLFGGYPWFAAEWQRPGEGFPWLRDTQAFRFLAPEIRETNALQDELERRWYAADAELAVLPRRDPRQRHMDKVYYMALTRFLPFLLDRVDRMSAAAGLRVQLPFVDHRLIELVWRLPHQVKSTGGMEKGLLRKAFEAVLPPEVAWRGKSGFAVGKSPHYLKAMFDYARETFDGGGSPIADLVDAEYLRSFIGDGAWSDGTFNGPPTIPRLVMLDMWMRCYGVSYESS
jgi:asparagine synthase (glutamine-hydrolysing)